MAVLALTVVAAATAAAAGACGDDDAGSAPGPCDGVEQLIEPTEGHVLPGGTVAYQHHPPTSGRHLAELPARGVHTEPIEEVSQVYALESGFVLLQYGPALGEAGRAALARFADHEVFVIVAPAVSIDGDRAVALTAWQQRQLCDDVSTDAVQSFVDRFAGRGPGGD
jgi:hypothetical protein